MRVIYLHAATIRTSQCGRSLTNCFYDKVYEMLLSEGYQYYSVKLIDGLSDSFLQVSQLGHGPHLIYLLCSSQHFIFISSIDYPILQLATVIALLLIVLWLIDTALLIVLVVYLQIRLILSIARL
jgi:hypothetical protein